MNADFKKPTAKPSAIAQNAGFKIFGHSTSMENLIQILNSGSLQISDNGQGSRGIYAQLFKDESFTSESKYQIRIVFKMELLDRDNYYANAGWQYGAYNAFSASPLINRGRLEYFIRNLGSSNEFVFQESIGIEAIDFIQVPKGSKEIILRGIKNRKAPNGRPWAELFIEI